MQEDIHDTYVHQFNQSIEPYFSEYHREKVYPGLISEQGKRKMVQINVPASDLLTLLQSKPSTNNDPDSGKNRNEDHKHVQGIKEYIIKQARKDKPWILGTLTANVNPQGIRLIEMGRGICIVVIKRSATLDITDGQHRKRAIQELMLSSDSELIGGNDFPITLVLEGDFNQCQKDFRDMAQTKALDKSLLLSFGEFEGKVGIMKNIQKGVSMFFDKTEHISKSPNSKRKLIFTNNYIARFVSCVFTNNPNHDLLEYDVEMCSKILIDCLNLFFDKCSSTKYIANTQVNNLTIEDVISFKDNCVLSKSVGLETLGRLLYFAYESPNNRFDTHKVIELAEVDWSKSNKMWEDNIGSGTNATAVKEAVEKVKVSLSLSRSSLTSNQVY